MEQCSDTCDAVRVLDTLSSTFVDCNTRAQIALCGALPILATWDTPAFCSDNHLQDSVTFMLNMPDAQRTNAMQGLGQLASVCFNL